MRTSTALLLFTAINFPNVFYNCISKKNIFSSFYKNQKIKHLILKIRSRLNLWLNQTNKRCMITFSMCRTRLKKKISSKTASRSWFLELSWWRSLQTLFSLLSLTPTCKNKPLSLTLRSNPKITLKTILPLHLLPNYAYSHALHKYIYIYIYTWFS